MNGRVKAGQWLVAIGCFILFVGAGLHLVGGYPRVSKILAVAPLDAGLKAGLKAVWFLIGWEWIVLGVIALIAAFTDTRVRKPITLIAGLALLVDAAVMLKLIGWFIGSEITLASGLLVLAGGLAFASAGTRVEERAISSRVA